MRDVLDSLETWRQNNEEIAVATVVKTWGSAPRPVGSKLIITHSGSIAGSVSGGCVEGAVIDEGISVLDTGKPSLLTFQVADEEAWDVGLPCGGTIQVFVEPFSALDGIYGSLKQHLENRVPIAVAGTLKGPPEYINRKLIVLEGGHIEGDLIIPAQTTLIVNTALEMLGKETGGILDLKEASLFIEVYPPTPRMIIIGAVHIAEKLVSIARTVGFDTIVVDPRRAFLTRERFPHASKMVQEWPSEALPGIVLNNSAYIVVLSHDPKLDDPALQVALRSKAHYVGALGSRRLRAAGLTDEQIARLHAPIGLDIRARLPGEIALSIMAEVIKIRNIPPLTLLGSIAF
jgi:xanthine dehydrogenase accessory factor